MGYHFSKSRYCSAVQCPKMLWLKKHKPECFDDSAMNEAVLEAGSEVGDLAMGLFGEYTEVPYGDLSNMILITEKLMKEEIPTIAEASFSIDGLFCSVDILKNHGNEEVSLYEVKSATSIHEIYYHDVAFQYHILSKLGYKIRSCNIVHINNQYMRCGELDINELFVKNDITDDVIGMQAEVTKNIEQYREYLKQTEEPADDIGQHCFDPYACGFWGYCTKHLPKPNVFDVSGARMSTKLKYYYQGIHSFMELNNCGAFSLAQQKQIQHEVLDLPAEIDKTSIRNFLDTLSYPIYFLDFESFQPAVPLFDYARPYEQIAFQYSLHYIETEDGDLKHKEFLAYPGGDPRRTLAEQMCRDIPMDVCVTAYNMGFEKGRIRGLAELYLDLREHLMNIHDNIQDLMIPFQKKWYYCKAMQGSYSIKDVLPALFPNDPTLDYHNLDGVHNGGEASAMFEKMAKMGPEELEIARKQLLSYCGLNTFAMVKVWEKLKEVVEKN